MVGSGQSWPNMWAFLRSVTQPGFSQTLHRTRDGNFILSLRPEKSEMLRLQSHVLPSLKLEPARSHRLLHHAARLCSFVASRPAEVEEASPSRSLTSSAGDRALWAPMLYGIIGTKRGRLSPTPLSRKLGYGPLSQAEPTGNGGCSLTRE